MLVEYDVGFWVVVEDFVVEYCVCFGVVFFGGLD